MDQSVPGAPAPPRPLTRATVAAVWWALALSALTAAGLGVLTAALLALHALGYGTATVLTPDTQVEAPEVGRYAFAFAFGVVVDAATAAVLGRLAPRTAVRTWPPVAQGLLCAVVAAACAVCALLLTLGLSPIGLLVDG